MYLNSMTMCLPNTIKPCCCYFGTKCTASTLRRELKRENAEMQECKNSKIENIFVFSSIFYFPFFYFSTEFKAEHLRNKQLISHYSKRLYIIQFIVPYHYSICIYNVYIKYILNNDKEL